MPENTSSQTNLRPPAKERDIDFAREVHAALLLQSPRGGRLILYMIILLSVAAIAWAWLAEVDDVVKGQGSVVPASHLQQIQNLEGGVVKEVLVREGQVVEAGDTLVVLDDIQYSAELERNALEAMGMQAAIERLAAESKGLEPAFTADLQTSYPEIIAKQLELWGSRSDNLQKQIEVLNLTHKEKEQELAQQEEKLASSKERFNLALQEQKQLEPLLSSGAVSSMEVLQAKQKTAAARAEMTAAAAAIPGLQTVIQESGERANQATTEFRQKAQEELNQILPKFKGLIALQKSLKDKVSRTGITSPVHGTVKKIYVDTIGGTVRPGMTMLEIVPLDDKLLIETKVAPKDIGFIRQEQKAKVKLSAYDYAVYGGLDGIVEQVSADSITDEKGRTYFLINVSIPHNFIGDRKDRLFIIPGMQAEVDVVVTRRKIIDYILRPLLKAKYN